MRGRPRRRLHSHEAGRGGMRTARRLATDKWVQYELSRESKDQMTNVMNVSQKLKEMDICERKREKTQVQIALVLFSIRALMMGLKRYCILRSLAR